MATYAELFDLKSNSALLNRITTAAAIAADAIRLEDGGTANHANRLIWAKQAFVDPESTAKQMIWGLLAINKAATASNIQNATDAAILTNVQALVDVYATGE